MIATGAGPRFCWLKTWSKKAKPLDKIPTYKISLYSNNIFEIITSSVIKAGMKVNIDPIRHWKAAIVNGKLNSFNNFEIKKIKNDQKIAFSKAILSPNLTVTLLISVKQKPPRKHIKIEGHTDQWMFFEKKKYAFELDDIRWPKSLQQLLLWTREEGKRGRRTEVIAWDSWNRERRNWASSWASSPPLWLQRGEQRENGDPARDQPGKAVEGQGEEDQDNYEEAVGRQLQEEVFPEGIFIVVDVTARYLSLNRILWTIGINKYSLILN